MLLEQLSDHMTAYQITIYHIIKSSHPIDPIVVPNVEPNPSQFIGILNFVAHTIANYRHFV